MGFVAPYYINLGIVALIPDPSKEIIVQKESLDQDVTCDPQAPRNDSVDGSSEKILGFFESASNLSAVISASREKRAISIITEQLQHVETNPIPSAVLEEGSYVSFVSRFLPEQISRLFFTPPAKIHMLRRKINNSNMKKPNADITSKRRSVRAASLRRHNRASLQKTNNEAPVPRLVFSPSSIVSPTPLISNAMTVKVAGLDDRNSLLSNKIKSWEEEKEFRQVLHQIVATPRSASLQTDDLAKATDHVTVNEIENMAIFALSPKLHRKHDDTSTFDSSHSDVHASWSVSITGAVTDFDPKPFVKYLMHVSYGKDSWSLYRRFNHFCGMHAALEAENFPSTVILPPLPSKRFWGNLNQDFIDQRKQQLQKYLQNIVMQRPIICSSIWKEFMQRDDFEVSPHDLNPTDEQRSVLDSTPVAPVEKKDESKDTLSMLISNMIPETHASLLMDDPQPFLKSAPLVVSQQPTKTKVVKKARSGGSYFKQSSGKFKTKDFQSGFDSVRKNGNVDGDKLPYPTLTVPLYELLDEVFELQDHGWLRKQMTWLFTQLIELSFDGTINDFVRNKVSDLTQESQIASLIDMITDSLWPEGTWRKGNPALTDEAKQSVRDAAKAKFLTFALNQSSVVSLLGSDNVKMGISKLFQFFQIEPLVKHLGFTVLDSLIATLFPHLESSIGRLKTDLHSDTLVFSKVPDLKKSSSEVSDSRKRSKMSALSHSFQSGSVPSRSVCSSPKDSTISLSSAFHSTLNDSDKSFSKSLPAKAFPSSFSRFLADDSFVFGRSD